jgi:hypothetical protein
VKGGKNSELNTEQTVICNKGKKKKQNPVNFKEVAMRRSLVEIRAWIYLTLPVYSSLGFCHICRTGAAYGDRH